MTYNGLLLP